MSSAKMSSVIALCGRLVRDMERTWQRLPRSPKLKNAPPIALRTSLAVHEGYKAPEAERPFHSPQMAIEATLAEADPPVAILCGGPGSGKTVALRWATREFALRVIEKPRSNHEPVPIYVDLGEWKTTYSDCSRLEGLLKKRRPRELSQAHSVIWLLDGLDLLPRAGPHAAPAVLEDARERAGARERFVLSTQPMPVIDATVGKWGQSWQAVLNPLDRDARLEWVREYSPEAETALSRYERDYPEHADFLDTPLLFSMVLSASLDEHLNEEKPFKWNAYPGPAGLFNGFATYLLNRACKDGRISGRQRCVYEEHQARIVEGVFWAALMSEDEYESGQQDGIPYGKVDKFLTRAFGSKDAEYNRRLWTDGVEVLQEAGLIVPTNDGAWGVLHLQFAEYWAAKHIASRLSVGARYGWYEAELWDHLRKTYSDDLVSQALAILSARQDGRELLQTAIDAIRSYSAEDALAIMAEVGGKQAARIVVSLSLSQDPSERAAAAEALGKLRGEQAVDALLVLVHDREPLVRSASAW